MPHCFEAFWVPSNLGKTFDNRQQASLTSAICGTLPWWSLTSFAYVLKWHVLQGDHDSTAFPSEVSLAEFLWLTCRLTWSALFILWKGTEKGEILGPCCLSCHVLPILFAYVCLPGCFSQLDTPSLARYRCDACGSYCGLPAVEGIRQGFEWLSCSVCHVFWDVWEVQSTEAAVLRAKLERCHGECEGAAWVSASTRLREERSFPMRL